MHHKLSPVNTRTVLRFPDIVDYVSYVMWSGKINLKSLIAPAPNPLLPKNEQNHVKLCNQYLVSTYPNTTGMRHLQAQWCPNFMSHIYGCYKFLVVIYHIWLVLSQSEPAATIPRHNKPMITVQHEWYFQMLFRDIKLFFFNSTEFCSVWSNWQYINGLARNDMIFNKKQAIIWACGARFNWRIHVVCSDDKGVVSMLRWSLPSKRFTAVLFE